MTKASDAASSPYLSDDELSALADRGEPRTKAMAAEILRLRKHACPAACDAGIQRCIDLLTKALGKTPAAVSEGIELLTIELAETRVDRDIKVENLTRERDAARQVAASADGDDSSELSQLRQALGLLSTLAPSLVVDTADPLGMAKRIAAVVSHTIESIDSDRAKALAANQDLARQAEAIPDVAARNACFALLEKALGEPSATVSAGIEKLITIVEQRSAANAAYLGQIEKLIARADTNANAALRNADLYKRNEEVYVNGIRSAHEVLTKAGIESPMPLADRVGKLIEQRDEARRERRESHALDAIYEALLAVCNSHGKRTAETFVAFVERLAQERNHARTRAAVRRRAVERAGDEAWESFRAKIRHGLIKPDALFSLLERRWTPDGRPASGAVIDETAAMDRDRWTRLKAKGDPAQQFRQEYLGEFVEPARGPAGERGTQMPGGVAPAPGAKPVPDSSGPIASAAAQVDAQILSGMLQAGDLFLAYEEGAWSSHADEFFIHERIGTSPWVRVRWRHGPGVSNGSVDAVPGGVTPLPGAGPRMQRELAAAHRQLDAAGAAPGTLHIGVGPGETFNVPRRIEWLVGLLHEKLDRAGVAREEMGSLNQVGAVTTMMSRAKSLSTRVDDLIDMLEVARKVHASQDGVAGKLAQRRDRWRERAETAEALARRWENEAEALIQNMAAISVLATSRKLEHYPMLIERAATGDVRKLLADYLEAKKACGAIANVAGLIEGAARAIAPREPSAKASA